MIDSIATVSLSGGLAEKLEAIAAAGFQGVEIFENDLLTYDGSPSDAGQLINDLGLVLVAFQPFRDFEGLPEPQRTRAFDRAERKFDLMQALGTDLLLVCSSVAPDSRGGIDRAAADLHELGERAAARGMRIGFEALAWGRHINDYRDAWEAVRRADHPAVGTILDTYHILARGLDLAAIGAIPADRIALVQVADAPDMDMGVLPLSRHFRCFPGQGRLPLLDFMKALLNTGYDGPLSLEVFNDQFRAAPARQIAIDGRRSLVYLREQLARLGDEPPPPGWTLPPSLHYDGLEFIEFAVDGEVAAQLRTLLGHLGFHLAGQHRSKAVTLWRQGGINLVVNAESEGFAHAFNLLHGPSVCALGLRVADARTAIERAEAYLCRPYRQSVGPGELEIPAILGLEGSLIYLVERYGDQGSIWEVDFELLDPPPQSDGPLEHIDHLSQVIPHGALLTWLLFYRSVFDLDATGELDIPDPSGLIQSHVVQSSDKSIRIALNASQAQGTLAADFLTTYRGGGVQQVAFSSPDLFATVARLRRAGVRLLHIPGNYYDDLDARFGLDAALLAQLRQNDVLYDRDADGEFFHVYTETFAGRFFFEILQRKGYQQFGAANAPIRLAAQHR